jgi:hypothetical protein
MQPNHHARPAQTMPGHMGRTHARRHARGAGVGCVKSAQGGPCNPPPPPPMLPPTHLATRARRAMSGPFECGESEYLVVVGVRLVVGRVEGVGGAWGSVRLGGRWHPPSHMRPIVMRTMRHAQHGQCAISKHAFMGERAPITCLGVLVHAQSWPLGPHTWPSHALGPQAHAPRLTWHTSLLL